MQFSKFIHTQSTVILLQIDTHIEHRSKASYLYDKEKYKEMQQIQQNNCWVFGLDRTDYSTLKKNNGRTKRHEELKKQSKRHGNLDVLMLRDWIHYTILSVSATRFAVKPKHDYFQF